MADAMSATTSLPTRTERALKSMERSVARIEEAVRILQEARLAHTAPPVRKRPDLRVFEGGEGDG
jgi:hypothetical protein